MKREEWLHHEWLSLLEISGPFLSIEVLKEKLPQGLESIDASVKKRLRVAYDEWDEAWYENDPQLDELLNAWVKMVLHEVLEYEESEFIVPTGDEFTYCPMEHDGSISADFAIGREGEEKPDFFVCIQEAGTDLDKILPGDAWPVNVLERVVKLCRDKEVRFALVTNGERWTLVNAPRGSMSSTVSWYARIWFQEPVTFRAFRTLLGVSRLYGSAENRLEALLDESLEKHEEVTDTLGEQVRRAVEVLVQSLDRADRDRNRELLKDVEAKTLYEAGLTVMMRLVFVLSAEERNLLLLGDPVYDRHYAVSSLRSLLSEDADRHGTEVLERRYDAWSRLLAVFRAVYGGIEHESLRMPALGGSLFDPDRFPFLEGRSKGSNWKEESAKPLPIDNRTVLLLLKALQILERSGGALQLSYKALDVEQIGHVYEGLLEYTVKRMPELTLGLSGSKKAKNPTITLEELETLSLEGVANVAKELKEITGRGISPLKKELEKAIDEKLYAKVILACGGDADLAERIRPYAHLLSQDAWGELLVYEKDSFAVMPGSDRSATGAHYTPKSLTESVVARTLEPILYEGPAEGKPRAEWALISAEKIVSLKICDPAMGSGAFLVQACRYLAERLVEAWGTEEKKGRVVTAQGEVLAAMGNKEPLSKSLDDRLILARRLVAERCLYGVDLNPLAVELAKLSLWLVTLSKGRPFGFLDHSLRSGDSLLGIDDINKLIKFTMEPDKKIRPTLFAKDLEEKIQEVLQLRDELRSICILDIEDVETMKKLDEKAKEQLSIIKTIADAMIGEVLRTGGKKQLLQKALDALSSDVAEALNGDEDSLRNIQKIARRSLSIDLPEGEVPRKPFHWALEFPEVFVKNEGFNAIIGNPPFLGGQKITGFMGTVYRDYLVNVIAGGKSGSADLVAYFFLKVFALLKEGGTFGLLATNTIAEGKTREVGLSQLLEKKVKIFAAYPNEVWPGNAAVVTSRVHIIKAIDWEGSVQLNDIDTPKINSFLSTEDGRTPNKLIANINKTFQGTITLGPGFVISEEDGLKYIKKNPEYENVLFPYLNGKDFTSTPNQKASRWVISFWDWALEKCQNYPEALKIVEEKVKPERQRKKEDGTYALRKPLPDRWWQYAEKRPALYHAIGRGHLYEKHPKGTWPIDPFKEVLVISAQATKYVALAAVTNNQIFSNSFAIFAFEQKAYFSLLQSGIHNEWSWKNGSKMKRDLRYTPSDILETMPFPKVLHPDYKKVNWENPLIVSLESIGSYYHKTRQQIMLNRQIGLTDFYNLFHNPEVIDGDIEELRQLHIKMDEAVKIAYGWNDLDFCHDFHEVPYLPENDRMRFTVSEEARLDILKRLLDLNEERYQEEVEAGLWDKKGTKKVKKSGQGGLF